MLDRLCTDLLGLDGLGGARLFADLSQYESARDEAQKKSIAKPAAKTAPPPPKPPAKKLTFKEQYEWDQIEAKIMAAEEELDKNQAMLGDPAVMADHRKMADAGNQVAAAQAAVDILYRRWEELAEKRGE
jgi:ATP-binding cassette subfamily F protein uup